MADRRSDAKYALDKVQFGECPRCSGALSIKREDGEWTHYCPRESCG